MVQTQAFPASCPLCDMSRNICSYFTAVQLRQNATHTKKPGKNRAFSLSSQSVGGQDTTTHLVTFDRLEQRLEVALAKPIVAFALDEFEEHWAHQGFREDLQQ